MQTQERRLPPDEIPAQQLEYPAQQSDMVPAPDSDLSNYQPANKLQGRVALITGGDSGIGRAVVIAYAMEGADVAFLYNENDSDAEATYNKITELGRRCLAIKFDVRDFEACQAAVTKTVDELGQLNILVNNVAYQMTQKNFAEISLEQFRRTMANNVFDYFDVVKAALPHLKEGDVIINTGSIVGKVGKGMLVDYAASKGAVHTFTKSLALNLAGQGIRVNAVVPGPVWTPNIPATMPEETVGNFDTDVAMNRAAQPEELAPTYVYMAAQDSSFVTGALLGVAGGLTSS